MGQLLRQNPILRIAFYFGLGVYLLNHPMHFYAQMTICLLAVALLRFIKTKIFLSACMASMCMLMGSAQQFLLTDVSNKNFITDSPLREFNSSHLENDNEKMFQNFLTHHDSSEAGLMVALLVGDTQYISHFTKRQYKSLGLSHLLAVSGMHIGLIFQSLVWLLQITTRNRLPKLTVIAGLMLIWGFTHIGQYSPSLLRASIMFSFMQLGKMWNERCGALNALGISFLVLLMTDPQLQFHWGFILSHLAVLGIVLHHRRWQQNTIHMSRIKRWFIQSLVTTWNAQLYTSLFLLPITLLFPTYFLLSNFLLVPFFSLLLFTCFGEWAFGHCIPQMPFYWINEGILELLKLIIAKLHALPHLQWQLHYTWWGILLLLALVSMAYYTLLEAKWARALKMLFWTANLGCSISIFNAALSKPEIHLWRERKDKKRLWSHQGYGQYSGQQKTPSIFLMQKGVPIEQSP